MSRTVRNRHRTGHLPAALASAAASLLPRTARTIAVQWAPGARTARIASSPAEWHHVRAALRTARARLDEIHAPPPVLPIDPVYGLPF